MNTLVVFTEEMSAKVMLESLLPRLLPANEYHLLCIAFEGKRDLEKQLPIKLKGWRTPNTHFVVLQDQDAGECKEIKQSLQSICRRAGKHDVLVRIACRELESWYFGDLIAVEKALAITGIASLAGKANYRNPDAIPQPSKALKRVTKNQYQKISSSCLIGHHLSLNQSRSASFRHFVQGVCRILKLEQPITEEG